MFFAQNLKFLRVQKGLTQVQLEKELNIKRATLSNYEVGTREPDINTLCQIARYFEISLDNLILEDLKPPMPLYISNIKYLRKQNNMIQADLASFLKVTQKSVSKYELGERGMSIEQLEKISKYFNITLDQLVKQDLSKEVSE